MDTADTADAALATQIPLPVEAVVVSHQRHFLAVFFFSFLWGTLGVDRFYLGKIWTGILKLLTFGGLGLWTLIDLVLIMSGSMRDKQGNEMLGAAQYKKFASNTVLLFAILTGLTVLVTGILAIVSITQIITLLQEGGGLENLIPSGMTIPGIDQIDPSQLQNL